MSVIEIPLKNPQYLSPGLAVGEDPSGQLVCFFRKEGEPSEKLRSLMDRAVALCNLEYLEGPFILNGRVCNKLKHKEKQDG